MITPLRLLCYPRNENEVCAAEIRRFSYFARICFKQEPADFSLVENIQDKCFGRNTSGSSYRL